MVKFFGDEPSKKAKLDFGGGGAGMAWAPDDDDAICGSSSGWVVFTAVLSCELCGAEHCVIHCFR